VWGSCLFRGTCEYHCRANAAHTKQSGPDFGFDLARRGPEEVLAGIRSKLGPVAFAGVLLYADGLGDIARAIVKCYASIVNYK
jgi:hypothetical protein